jgi:hypothetical protein
MRYRQERGSARDQLQEDARDKFHGVRSGNVAGCCWAATAVLGSLTLDIHARMLASHWQFAPPPNERVGARLWQFRD